MLSSEDAIEVKNDDIAYIQNEIMNGWWHVSRF